MDVAWQEAILAWVSIFDVEQPQDFEDLGTAHTLSLLLHECDPDNFAVLPVIVDDEATQELHDLESLFNSIGDWITRNLEFQNPRVPLESIHRIAYKSPGFTSDLIDVCHFLLLISVRSESNPSAIRKIQELLQAKDQFLIMEMIEKKMIQLKEEDDKVGGHDSAVSDTITRDLELENRSLALQVKELVHNMEQLQFKNLELQEQIAQSEYFHDKRASRSVDGSDDDDEKMALRAKLRDMELKLAEALENAQPGISHSDRIALLEETLSKKDSIIQDLHDQLDALRSAAEKAQQMEMTLAKYKKKVSFAVDYKKKFQAAQETIAEHVSRIDSLSEDLRQFPVVINSYKNQVVQLETKTSSLSADLEQAQSQLIKVEQELEAAMEGKTQDQERLSELTEKLRQIELNAIIGLSETPEEDDDGNVEGMQELSNNQVKKQLADLTLKVDALQAEKRDLSDKLLLSTHRLEDIERLKSAFENDYRRTQDLLGQSQRKCASIEHKLSTLSNASQLESRLQDNERLLSDALTLNSDQTAQLEMYKKSAIDAQLQSQSQVAQVNKLLLEKETLGSHVSTLSIKVSELERIISNLKATKSALEARSSSTTPNDTLTKLGTATHKLVQLTDQNSHLHSALKKAREHILLQDRLLKESSLSSVEGQKSSRLFQEAFQSFEAQVKDKEAEIERLKGELGFVTNGGKKEERRGGMVGMAMWPDEDATVSAVPRSQNSWIQGQWNRL